MLRRKRIDDDDGDDASAGDENKKTDNPFFDKTAKKRKHEGEEGDDGSSSSDWTDTDDDSDDDDDDDGDKGEGENPKETSAEEDLIAALKASKEKKDRNCPPDIALRDAIDSFSDLSFHPEKNLVAGGTLEGHIFLYEYSNEKNEVRKKFAIHKGAVRSLEFDGEGNIYSGGKDKAVKVTDVETSAVRHRIPKAHKSPLYKVRPIDEHLFASGDEDGVVKLWDNRIAGWEGNAVMECKQFDEFVSDLFVDDAKRMMVASSGEGTIQSFNIRGKKPDAQSEVYEGEMNCLGLVHHDAKLVAGCGDGRLYMFNWGEFGLHSADFPGHPDAINHLVAVTENVLITACEDGTIRAVHLYPHRFLGTVGHHSGDPIERLDVSAGGELVASVSHDSKIKFWNISYLEDMEYNKTRKPFFNKKELMNFFET